MALRRFLFAAIAASLLSITAAAQDVKQDFRLGLRAGPDQWPQLAAVLSESPAEKANPMSLTLAIPASWAASPDWQAITTALSSVPRDGVRLAVVTELPAGPEDEASLSYLVALSEHAAPFADTLGLSLRQASFPKALLDDPDQLALAIKRLSSALRGAGGGHILLGELDEASLQLLEPLYSRELRAYVDGYSTMAVNSSGEPSRDLLDFLQKFHPGAQLWVHLPEVKTPMGAQVLSLAALNAGASAVDVQTPDAKEIWKGLRHLRSLISPAMGVGVVTEASGIWSDGKYRSDIGVLNFLDVNTYLQGILLVANRAGSQSGDLEVVMPAVNIAEAKAYPLPFSPEIKLSAEIDQKNKKTTLKVPWKGTPVFLLVAWRQSSLGGEGQVTVSGEYRIPVELILARYQAVQEAEDILCDNYTAKAQVDYHFKLPGSTGSLDVTFMNTFFYEKGVGARWVQNQLLVNGVAWKGKTIPELPIIEPEKVNTLPLALTLGRDYSYKYLRDETVNGHDCYLVAFIPLPEAKGSLYEGKVWIDKKSYTKVKMSVRQTRLQPPQVSNDETDNYEPVAASQGRNFQLLTAVTGQQIFTVAGQSVVAERKITFSDVRINAAEFKEDLAKAEASDKPMLQDTQKGPRYLVKKPDGTRVLQMEPKTSKWLAVGGAYYDDSLDYPIPLVGVNYLNYDWHKKKIQVNLFVAGLVDSLSVSKADLFPKVDGSLNALAFLIPFEDKYYIQGTEDKAQRLKVLSEHLSGALGWRPTQFSRLTLGLDSAYYRFTSVGETSPDFVLPKDHGDFAFTLAYDYSRRGWQAAGEYESHHRTSWEPWGLPGEHADVSAQKNYALWDATFSKTFYLPKFQKIGAAVSWLDGKDLDRFSQYQFTYLGRKSLSGFAGSGVRFDKGATLRVLYEFNVADVVRFGVNVDRARVKPNRDEDLWQNHTGLGISGAIAGPWQTFWTLDVGYALQSDIPAVKHEATVALVVLKLW
jgi:hypothetical protein